MTITMQSDAKSVPHTRGDEPIDGCFSKSVSVPTPVGMNRKYHEPRIQYAFPTPVGMNRSNINLNYFAFPTPVGMNRFLAILRRQR